MVTVSRNRNDTAAATTDYKGYYRTLFKSCTNLKYVGNFPGYNIRSNVCDDYVTRKAPYPIDKPLDLSKYWIEPMVLDGCAYPGQSRYYFDCKIPDRLDAYYLGLECDTKDWAYWQTLALEKFNPNKPVWDIPLFLFELKDIPRMIKSAIPLLRDGITKAQQLPDLLLSYNLGWRPLLNDLFSMIDYAEAVDKRIAFLKEMGGRGKTHELTLLNRSRTKLHSNVTYPRECVIQYRYTHRVWAKFRYDLDVSGLPERLGDSTGLERLRRQIAQFRQFGGGRASFQTAWNALPWSFLFDYFVNIDSFLGAHRTGGIPWEMYGLHIMSHDTCVARSTPTGSSASILSSGRSSLDRKNRRYFATPRATIGFEQPLTNREIANVAALSIRPFLKG